LAHASLISQITGIKGAGHVNAPIVGVADDDRTSKTAAGELNFHASLI
jgi:hypothetical protein